MKKTAFLIMIITIISKFFGFGREIVLSYVYGASAVTDAYLISQAIPIVVFAFISTGVANAYIPMYSRISSEQSFEKANLYTSNLSNALLLLATVVVTISLFFTQPIVKMFASGFDGETLELAINFTRISIFGIYITALINIFASYLRIHTKYIIPALMGFPMNLVIISSLVISTKTSVYVIAIGSVLAIISQLILLAPFVYKTGYRHKLIFSIKDDYLKEMFLIALPVMAGTTVNEINILIDRTLASGIAVGGISALNYANRLNEFVQGLFVTSITTVIYPVISKMATEKNIQGLKSSIAEAISIINLMVIPTTIGAMIFSREIVSLLFGRGAFTPEAVTMTGKALFYYSIGMTAFGLRDVLSRAFYAFQDTRTPMVNATIGVVINIVLNITLSRYMGIGGLALATSISATTTAVLLFLALRKKIGGFGLKGLLKSFIKIAIASLIMGLTAYVGFRLMQRSLNQNLSLILSIIFGGIIYAVIVFFMNVPEVDDIFKNIKKGMGATEGF